MHLIHRLREPNAAIEHPPLLVLLHGIGSNEQDLYSLAPLLDERLVVVSARAPLTLAPGMYSWFTIEIGGNGLKINYAELERSRDAVIEFVRQAAGSHDVDPRKIFLMGFSQGAMLSAAVAFAEPSMFAGAVLMSGAILPESTGKAAILGRLVGFPLMATHGVNDTVIPIELARAGYQACAPLELDLTYQEFDMAHEINQESFEAVTNWLRAQLAK